MALCLTFASVCQGLSGYCVFLCVSVPEKADLRELCSTFPPLLIHPSLPLCLPGWTGWKEREKEGVREKRKISERVKKRDETVCQHSFLFFLSFIKYSLSSQKRNEHMVYFVFGLL